MSLKLTIEIDRDELLYELNPREDENLGTFWGWHRRYASPDKGAPKDPPRVFPKGAIGLPVWLYDHSGLVFRAATRNPFTCPWDSGQFGIIFTTAEKAATHFGWGSQIVNMKRRFQIYEALKSEVLLYDAWQRGNVWRWAILDCDDMTVEGCGGYICPDPTDVDAMVDEALASLKSCLKEGESVF